MTGRYPIEAEALLVSCPADVQLVSLARTRERYQHIFRLDVSPDTNCPEVSIQAGRDESSALIVERSAYHEWVRVHLDASSEILATRNRKLLDRIDSLDDEYDPYSTQ